MKLYRIIEYVGSGNAIETILKRSLNGTYAAGETTITAAVVKEGGITFEQKAKLKSARQKKRGWPGQQGF